MFLGAFAITNLVKIEFFATNPLVAKITVMGAKFVFNFFSKRWIFENPKKVKA